MRNVLMGAVIAAAGVFASHAASAQDMKDVQIEAADLGNGIHMLMGRGGNIGLSAGEDGVFMIDDQFAPLTPKILAAVAKISEKPVRFVLNTHWHFDHTGGNENLGKAGVAIVAHDNVRKLMSADQFLKAFGRKVPAAPKAALPVVTFSDGVTFHLNGETIRVFHAPAAHTGGDSVVHFVEADVVHMGDTYFNGRYPFIDFQHGGSIDGMVSIADKVLAMAGPETKIIPGHGPLSNKTELKAYRDMLENIGKRMAAALAEGKTLEDLYAASPTAEFDAEWGNGFLKPKKFLEIVYTGMKQ
jgi:cyclase